jgi:hypothetical protein
MHRDWKSECLHSCTASWNAFFEIFISTLKLCQTNCDFANRIPSIYCIVLRVGDIEKSY